MDERVPQRHQIDAALQDMRHAELTEREFICQVHNVDNTCTYQLLQWQAASGDISPS